MGMGWHGLVQVYIATYTSTLQAPYTSRVAGGALKLLVGLPCLKQIKYVCDYGVSVARKVY